MVVVFYAHLARGKNKTYWYYKLHAPAPTFKTTQDNKLSKYKHLGKAGSPAHIDAVMQVARRTQIDYLQSCIDSREAKLGGLVRSPQREISISH